MKTTKIYQEDEGPVLCMNCGKEVMWLSDRKHYKAKDLVPSGGLAPMSVLNGKHEDRCEFCEAPYYMQRVYDDQGKFLGIKYKLTAWLTTNSFK
jgi:hypothetical protein